MHIGIPFFLVLFCVASIAVAEVGLAPEPVGNATDRAVVEKKPKLKKPVRNLSEQEKAHRMAHPHHKRKGKKGAKS